MKAKGNAATLYHLKLLTSKLFLKNSHSDISRFLHRLRKAVLNTISEEIKVDSVFIDIRPSKGKPFRNLNGSLQKKVNMIQLHGPQPPEDDTAYL